MAKAPVTTSAFEQSPLDAEMQAVQEGSPRDVALDQKQQMKSRKFDFTKAKRQTVSKRRM